MIPSVSWGIVFNLLNAELNPTCHLLALLAHTILHISSIRVNYSGQSITGHPIYILYPVSLIYQ
jgi:hypothetical protein